MRRRGEKLSKKSTGEIFSHCNGVKSGKERKDGTLSSSTSCIAKLPWQKEFQHFVPLSKEAPHDRILDSFLCRNNLHTFSLCCVVAGMSCKKFFPFKFFFGGEKERKTREMRLNRPDKY
jgi:hypothetical protein